MSLVREAKISDNGEAGKREMIRADGDEREKKDKEGIRKSKIMTRRNERNEEEIENRLITSGCLQDINNKMIEFRGNDCS